MPTIHIQWPHRLLLVTALCAGGAHAADNAVTVYGGWRMGGSFTDANSNETLGIDNDAAGAITLDLALDGKRQWQVYLSRQSTRLELGEGGATVPTGQTMPLKITYLHVGGSLFFDGPVGKGPYVVGGIGATVLEPGLDAYKTEVRPSMNLGIGYQFPLGESVALRAEARGQATLVDSNGSFFCSGGCVVAIKGNLLTQGEVMLGLSLRF